MELNNLNNPVTDQETAPEPMSQYSAEPQALPMMDLWESVRICFRKYFNFKGRARRSEYWWFFLFTLVVCVIWALFGTLLLALPVSMMIERLSGNMTAGITTMIIILVVPLLFLVLPSFSVQVRRLHDIGRSGWWVLVMVVLEIISEVLLFVYFGTSAIDLGFKEQFTKSFELSTALGWTFSISYIVAELLSIALIVFSCIDSNKTENRYGPSPKYQQNTNVC